MSQPKQPDQDRFQADIPVRTRHLRDEQDAPDYIAPLAAVAVIVALLGTTCLPLYTVASMIAIGDTALPAPQDTPAAQPAEAPHVPVVTLAFVIVFFLIAVVGIVGGLATIFRRNWGRRLLLAYAGLVLVYLITAVYLRMRFGIEGLTATAPTASALSLHLTCTLGVLLLVAVLMVVILRYFTQPHIARRFR